MMVITDLGASTRLHEPDPRVLATQMDEARHWLRQHGSDLHRYGAEFSSRKREL